LAVIDESTRGIAPLALSTVKPTKQSSLEAIIESSRCIAIEALATVEPKKQSDLDGTLESPRGVAIGHFDVVRSGNRSAWARTIEFPCGVVRSMIVMKRVTPQGLSLERLSIQDFMKKRMRVILQ
jgi:hypothetical protein